MRGAEEVRALDQYNLCEVNLWLRVGSVDGGTTIVEIPYLTITKHFLRSEMLDLTRFPVSDEFISDRKTFCTILDRKHFLDFLNYWFSTKGHVTTEHMDLWRLRWRIQ